MRCATLLSLLSMVVLGGCYAHGWPFDDKRMCGAAYPQSKAECEAQQPSAKLPLPTAEVLAVRPSLGSFPGSLVDVRFTNESTAVPWAVRQYELQHGPRRMRIETSFEIPPGGSIVRRVSLGPEFAAVREPLDVAARVLP